MRSYTVFVSVLLFLSTFIVTDAIAAEITGEMKQWHRVTLTFDGPETHELDINNPFLHYRLNVEFTHGDKSYLVPGFYAADGDAAETSAKGGNKWRVHFTPDTPGKWNYTVFFRTGNNIAVSDNPEAGEAVYFDGDSGSFAVKPTDKSGRDFRAKGRLSYVDDHYLQFDWTGDFFLKGGADSPENFLAYVDFDGTYYSGDKKNRKGESAPNLDLHSYEPHAKDWKSGDPSWQDGKGKNIIGALNYLASKGMNSVYMLTMNVHGDGDDVWPWTDRNERYRFDCSKLAQWEIVFSHMDRLGLMLHFVTQETENELLLDIGNLWVQRKLYYRELIARFSHHLGITWNLGEENGAARWTPFGQNTEQRKAMAAYFHTHDPYGHLTVVHSHSNPSHKEETYPPLLGFKAFDGPSLQVGNPADVHFETVRWRERSDTTDHKWVVCLDEIGPAHTGAKPDADDPDHDFIRKHVLWGNLMGGGAGVEWYFGYKYAHNDLNCEDWRSRDNLWDLTRYALEFFQQHIPFWEMKSADELIDTKYGYCFTKPGEIYVVYLTNGGTTTLDVGETDKTFSVEWYNPRTGGDFKTGAVASVSGPGKVLIGMPPNDSSADWVALIRSE